MDNTSKAEAFLITRKQVRALRQQFDLFASAVEQEPDPNLRSRYKQTLSSIEIELKRLEKVVKSIWSSIFPWIRSDSHEWVNLVELEERLRKNQTMYNKLSTILKNSRDLETQMRGRLPQHIVRPSDLSEVGMPLVAWESRPDNPNRPQANPADAYGTYDTRPPFKPFWEGSESESASARDASLDNGNHEGKYSSSQFHSPHQSSISGFQPLSPPPYHRRRAQVEPPAEAEAEANPRSSLNPHFRYPLPTPPSEDTNVSEAKPSSGVQGNAHRREGEPSYSQTDALRSQAPFVPQNRRYGPTIPAHSQGGPSQESAEPSQQRAYNDDNMEMKSEEDEDDMYMPY